MSYKFGLLLKQRMQGFLAKPQGFLANPCTCETLCLMQRLVVSGGRSMTATFLNCHQDMFPEKFPQKIPS
jgi:hypothetical protein